MFRQSYGHDLKFATFLWSRRAFYILRTSTYDAWKIFCRPLKSKVFTQNSHRMTDYSEVWQSFRYLNLKNPLESHFSFNKKSFVSRTVTIQSALHYPDLGQCFTNSERIHTTHFLRAPKVKVFAKNPHKMTEYSKLSETKCMFFGKDFDFRGP